MPMNDRARSYLDNQFRYVPRLQDPLEDYAYRQKRLDDELKKVGIQDPNERNQIRLEYLGREPMEEAGLGDQLLRTTARGALGLVENVGSVGQYLGNVTGAGFLEEPMGALASGFRGVKERMDPAYDPEDPGFGGYMQMALESGIASAPAMLAPMGGASLGYLGARGLAGTALGGRALAGLGRATGLTAEKALERSLYGGAIAGGTVGGAVSNAGLEGGTTFSQTKQELMQQGIPEAAADQEARRRANEVAIANLGGDPELFAYNVLQGVSGPAGKLIGGPIRQTLAQSGLEAMQEGRQYEVGQRAAGEPNTYGSRFTDPEGRTSMIVGALSQGMTEGLVHGVGAASEYMNRLDDRVDPVATDLQRRAKDAAYGEVQADEARAEQEQVQAELKRQRQEEVQAARDELRLQEQMMRSEATRKKMMLEEMKMRVEAQRLERELAGQENPQQQQEMKSLAQQKRADSLYLKDNAARLKKLYAEGQDLQKQAVQAEQSGADLTPLRNRAEEIRQEIMAIENDNIQRVGRQAIDPLADLPNQTDPARSQTMRRTATEEALQGVLQERNFEMPTGPERRFPTEPTPREPKQYGPSRQTNLGEILDREEELASIYEQGPQGMRLGRVGAQERIAADEMARFRSDVLEEAVGKVLSQFPDEMTRFPLYGGEKRGPKRMQKEIAAAIREELLRQAPVDVGRQELRKQAQDEALAATLARPQEAAVTTPRKSPVTPPPRRSNVDLGEMVDVENELAAMREQGPQGLGIGGTRGVRRQFPDYSESPKGLMTGRLEGMPGKMGREFETAIREDLIRQGKEQADFGQEPITSMTDLGDLSLEEQPTTEQPQAAADADPELTEPQAGKKEQASGLTPLATSNRAVMPNGESARLVLADLADLKASNNLEGEVNPDFVPAGGVQPRQRVGIGEDASLQSIVAAPNELRLLENSATPGIGMPIVNQQGAVLSGNNRTRALQYLQKNDPAFWARYESSLLQQADALGFSQEELQQVLEEARAQGQRPVLVRQLTQDINGQAFAEAENTQSIEARSISEQASQLAGKLSITDVSNLTSSGEKISVPTATMREKLRARMGSPAEVKRYFDDEGNLSKEGVRLLENSLLQKAYGSELTQQYGTQITPPAQLGALVQAAASKLNADARIQNVEDAATQAELQALDITEDWLQATELYDSVKNNPDLLPDFSNLEDVASFENRIIPTLLKVMQGDGRKASIKSMREKLQAYHNRVGELASGFGGSVAPNTKEDLVLEVLGDPDRVPGQGLLFSRKTKPQPKVTSLTESQVKAAITGMKQVLQKLDPSGKQIQVFANTEAAAAALEKQGYSKVAQEIRSTEAGEGFVHNETGKVYLIADQIQGENLRGAVDRMVEVVFHEVIGHGGLRELMGDRYTPFIQKFGAKNQRQIRQWLQTPAGSPYTDSDTFAQTEEYIARNFAEFGAQDIGKMEGLVQAVASAVGLRKYSQTAVKRAMLQIQNDLVGGDNTGDILQGYTPNAGGARADQEEIRREAPTPRNAGDEYQPTGLSFSRKSATQLEMNFEQDPEKSTPADRSAFAGARDALGALLRRRNGSLLGSKISKNFQEYGATPLIGERVTSPEDLADLAEIYRNPKFETFRIFFVKDNKVVGQTGVTSRMPSAVRIFKDKADREEKYRRLWEQFQNLNADGYYLLHNHPSGNPEPSQADLVLTTNFAENFPGFKSHIVINGARFAEIKADGEFKIKLKRAPQKNNYLVQPDPTFGNPTKDHPLLWHMINSSDDVVRMAKSLEDPEQQFQIITRDAKGKVAGIASFPIQSVQENPSKIQELRMLAEIRAFQRQTGASTAILVNVPESMLPLVRKGIQNGTILDVILTDGRSLSADGILAETEVRTRSYWQNGESSSAVSFSRAPGGLLAMHNLNENKLRKVGELGGFVVPSVAVVKQDLPLKEYGDISILFGPDVVDPEKGVPTFDADVYSRRVPKKEYRTNYKTVTAVRQRFEDSIARLQAVAKEAKSYFPNPADLFIPAQNIGSSQQFKYAVDKGEWVSEYVGSDNILPVLAKLQYLTETQDTTPRLPKVDAGQSWGAWLKQANRQLEKKVAKDAEYSRWLESATASLYQEPVFDAAGPRSKTKLKPYTVENLLDAMTGRVRDQEGGFFGDGIGSARSVGAKKFRSLQEMRDRQDSLQDPQEVEKLKEELTDEFFALARDLTDYSAYQYPGLSGSADALADAIKKFYRKSSMAIALRSDFSAVPADLVRRIEAYAKKLQAAPTAYFESKPQRFVPLSEAKAAVVPKKLSSDLRQLLEKAGVPITTYDSTRDGARDKAIAKATKSEDLSFSKRPSLRTVGIEKQAEYALGLLEKAQRAMEPMSNLPQLQKYMDARRRLRGAIGNVEDIAKNVYEALEKTTQPQAIYEFLTTKGADPNQIQNSQERDTAVRAKKAIERLGDRLANSGLLEQSTVDAMRGQYLPNVYLKYLLKDQDANLFRNNRRPSDMGYLKKRKDIPEGVRKMILGQVTDPAYLTSRALMQPGRDLEILDWLSWISQNPEWTLQESLVDYNLQGRMAEIAQRVGGSPLLQKLGVRDRSVDRKALEQQIGDLRQEIRVIKKENQEVPVRGQGELLRAKQAELDELLGARDALPASYQVTPFYLKQEAERIESQILNNPEGPQLSAPERTALQEILADMRNAADAGMRGINDLNTEDYRQIPDSKRYGKLRGMVVRREIYDDLVGGFNMKTGDESFFEQILGDTGLMAKYNSLWKWSKVAANPPSYVRNFISNMILMNLGGMKFQHIPSSFLKATREMRNPQSRYSQLAKKYGIESSGFSGAELQRLENDFLQAQRRAMKNQGKTNPMYWVGAAKAAFANFEHKTGDLYGKIDVFGKMMMMIDAIENQGMSEADAAAHAEKWLFDYTFISPNVRYLRNAPMGAPFITFASKVAPLMLEVARTRPWAFAPYFLLSAALIEATKAAMDWDDDDMEAVRLALPDYLREKGKYSVVPLPLKDDNGRIQFLDISYLFPWGMFSEISSELARGELAGALQTAGLIGSPMMNIATAILTNQDPFSRQEIVDKTKGAASQVGDMINYAWNLSAPPMLHTSYGAVKRAYEGLTGALDKEGEPMFTASQGLARGVGLNVTPLDVRGNREKNLRRLEYELASLKRDQTRDLKTARNQRKDADDLQDIRDEYRELIEKKTAEIRDYQKRSRVPIGA